MAEIEWEQAPDGVYKSNIRWYEGQELLYLYHVLPNGIKCLGSFITKIDLVIIRRGNIFLKSEDVSRYFITEEISTFLDKFDGTSI